MKTRDAILLVEDCEDDIFLMKRALKGAGIKNRLIVMEDGQQAIDYLDGRGEFSDRATHPLPALIFLDLKLPIKDGFEVLKWIRANDLFECMIVVVLTSSNEPRDIKASYSLGANSYLVKPPTVDQLQELTRYFKGYWLEYNEFADQPA
jgi:CheY-like chemotaxis protein